MPNYSLQNGKQRCIVGHLGKDPETRQLKSTQVCTFSVAVTHRKQVIREDGRKEWVNEPTVWYSCKAFGSQATAVRFHFHKGDAVMVAGRDESWTGRDGRVFTDLVVEVIAKPIVIREGRSEDGSDIPF